MMKKCKNIMKIVFVSTTTKISKKRIHSKAKKKYNLTMNQTRW